MLSVISGDRDSASAKTPGSPQLERVIGRDFLWYFSLPGPHGRFDTSDDQVDRQHLELVVNHPVSFEITSDDYLYSFRAPALNLLEVAMPGMIFKAAFTPQQSERYRLEVGPMCGALFAHDNATMGWLDVLPNRSVMK